MESHVVIKKDEENPYVLTLNNAQDINEKSRLSLLGAHPGLSCPLPRSPHSTLCITFTLLSPNLQGPFFAPVTCFLSPSLPQLTSSTSVAL